MNGPDSYFFIYVTLCSTELHLFCFLFVFLLCTRCFMEMNSFTLQNIDTCHKNILGLCSRTIEGKNGNDVL